MAELADVEGSNPSEKSCGFKSHYPYRTILTDLLDGLNSNEEKQVRKVNLYIVYCLYDIKED